MITDEDRRWMRETIALARSKGTEPSDTPIAALIVIDGKKLAASINQTAEHNDATAHAEIMTIRDAGAAYGDMDLRGATLYSTLQPCGMCTMASIWSKVGRVVFGAGREDVHSMYFEAKHVDTLAFIADAYRDDIEIEGGCLAGECATLYYGPDAELPKEEQANL